jgi:hypothetical protein
MNLAVAELFFNAFRDGRVTAAWKILLAAKDFVLRNICKNGGDLPEF